MGKKEKVEGVDKKNQIYLLFLNPSLLLQYFKRFMVLKQLATISLVQNILGSSTITLKLLIMRLDFSNSKNTCWTLSICKAFIKSFA